MGKGLNRDLEFELTMPRPPNDDLKDALALAVSKIKTPLGKGIRTNRKALTERMSRFGSRRGSKR